MANGPEAKAAFTIRNRLMKAVEAATGFPSKAHPADEAMMLKDWVSIISRANAAHYLPMLREIWEDWLPPRQECGRHVGGDSCRCISCQVTAEVARLEAAGKE